MVIVEIEILETEDQLAVVQMPLETSISLVWKRESGDTAAKGQCILLVYDMNFYVLTVIL